LSIAQNKIKINSNIFTLICVAKLKNVELNFLNLKFVKEIFSLLNVNYDLLGVATMKEKCFFVA